MNKSTLKYIGKRLIISAITLFVILVVLFLMVRFYLVLQSITKIKRSTKSSYRGKIRIRQTFIYSVCYLRKRYAYR